MPQACADNKRNPKVTVRSACRRDQVLADYGQADQVCRSSNFDTGKHGSATDLPHRSDLSDE